MRYNKTTKTYRKLSFIITLSLGIASINTVKAENPINVTYTMRLDSIGEEIANGHRFLIHKVQPKENYYQLSRMYAISVNEIVEANNNKNLIIGDKVRIPRGKVSNKPLNPKPSEPIRAVANEETITYKVGKSETLYAISKKFRTTVDEIKQLNGLTSNSLKEGQLLNIPKKSEPIVPEPKPALVINRPEEIETQQPIDDTVFKPNRLGIYEKKEKGIGVWLESLSGDEHASLALHKTAPIGTILKITNPMNQSVTFAKVVGKFGDNKDTQGAIVVLSKSTAAAVGLLDKQFQIEINYGVPID